MDDMKDFRLWVEGSICYEKPKAMNDKNDSGLGGQGL